MFFDSHAHLEMPQFDQDREKMIERAKEAGIDFILSIGTDLPSCQRTLDVVENYDFIWAGLGIHPHDTKDIEENTYSQLKNLFRHKKVVALGEIGLDFFRNLSPPLTQTKRFREQIHLAQELNLPLIIHDREAHEQTLNILKEEGAKELGGVFHCFSGDYTLARKCLEMNFLISISGPVTFSKSTRLQELVKKLPLESLLIETDCPFLSPDPYRGKRNEPAYLPYTARKIAELKGVNLEEVGLVTTQNAKKLFKIDGQS